MGDEFSKRLAKEKLCNAGFKVEEVPPVTQKGQLRADLIAQDELDFYVIEAKSKFEHEKWIEYREQLLQPNAKSSLSRPIKPWNSISSTIREAADQLASTPAHEAAFRIAWFVAPHDDDEFVMECIKRRLYGLEDISVMERNFQRMTCYHYWAPDFQRYVTIDAAILSVRKGEKLCVNAFSSNRERFRKSRLYQMFQSGNMLCDPELTERDETVFIVGDDAPDPRSHQAIHQYLLKKYKVHISPLQQHQYNASFSVRT